MASTDGYNPVKLKFPKRCTPENLSLFSGFMATIPHLVAPAAKERYSVETEPRNADKTPKIVPMTKGQQLTHSILSAARQISESGLGERAYIAEIARASKRPNIRLTRPEAPSFSVVELPSRKRPRDDSAARIHCAKEKKVRYADAISTWDRVKRQLAETRSYSINEGTISSILNGVKPRSCSDYKPLKWSDRHRREAYSETSYTPPTAEANRRPTLFEEWASLDSSGDDSPCSVTLPRSIRKQEGRTSFSAWTPNDKSDNSSVVNDLLRDWFS
ncbi:hypothetical protein GCK32_014547 [Trichostrongylus colubriformis]|uniref:Uncharacterized protein n=1 Tax=Trichostrongylus colubriformis TaxID=6319 RepID=A0AAN8IV65_TRICO